MGIKFFKKDLKKYRLKLSKKLKGNGGYSILRSSKSLNENEVLIDLSKEYDEVGYMPQELGEELDHLFLADDYIIGIHRTGYTPMDDEMISSTFSKGLINNGDVMQGAFGSFGSYINIEKTVTICSNFPILNIQLKSANSYKGSDGCIIIKIPKSYLGKKDGDLKPIYYNDNGQIKLLPEFIYGYVKVDSEGKISNIIHNPNYSDIHDLDNTNLLYDSSALDKAKRQGINLENNDISLNDKYLIIKKAYQDTLIKNGDKQAQAALNVLINNNDVKYFTGKENKALLKKYIIYGQILKILEFGMDNPSNNKNDIINSFINDNKIENKNVISR